MFSSALQKAISRGMKEGGDLGKELAALGDYRVTSGGDAKAICKALASLPAGGDGVGYSSRLRLLTGLFQDVPASDVKAFFYLRNDGIEQLVRIFDELSVEPAEDDLDDLLFILKIFAMYGSEEGAARILTAAQGGLHPEGYLWHVVFSILDPEHPCRDRIFDGLRDSLPPGFIAVAFLDSANTSAIAGRLEDHPFDSPQGRARLFEWLSSDDPDEFSVAQSATAALPFISKHETGGLFALALNHVSPEVQIEAAWAAAVVGDESGIERLREHCLDFRHSALAQRYLEELGHEDAIPEEASGDDFQAKAELAQWLAHPNELGKPPDELEIVDRRTLLWPPDGEAKPMWFIKYRVYDHTGLEDDDVDAGVVGSVTFCLFSYEMWQRPPADAYAIHCYWEMEHGDLISEERVDRPGEYAALLDQWAGEALEEVEIRWVCEIRAELGYGNDVVALASAKRGGSAGWVVLDGPSSMWYPAAELPEGAFESTVLKMHVGRRILGFAEEPDRAKYLQHKKESRDPADIVDAYGRLLEEAKSGDSRRRTELLAGRSSPLGQHFGAYVAARADLTGLSRARATVDLYQLLLAMVVGDQALIEAGAYDTFRTLGGNLEAYVDALVELTAFEEIVEVVDLFKERWQHNLGYGVLGAAAYKAGDFALAEELLVKRRSSDDSWFRAEEMSLLARLWHRDGRQDEAARLLLECLAALVAEAAEAIGSDRNLAEDRFQHHRQTYLELFPEGAADLHAQGVPHSTM